MYRVHHLYFALLGVQKQVIIRHPSAKCVTKTLFDTPTSSDKSHE